MAWTLSSEGEVTQPGYAVYSETLTTKSLGNGTSNWTSKIDFIPPGKNFTIIANTAATNLSVSTHVELFTSWNKTATVASGRTRSDVTPFISLTAEVDTATVHLNRVVATHGEFPYYWGKIPLGGGSVTIKVLIYDPA